MEQTPIIVNWTTELPSQTKKKIEDNLAKNLLEMLILKELARSPSHGYELMQRIKKIANVSIGASIVYPKLADLEHEGLITSEWNMTEFARPRKIYHTTKKGTEALQISINTVRIILGGIN